MSSNNPSVTASDIITDVEARLATPGISTATYLPWISYAYQRTYQALANTNQQTKEELFGVAGTISLTQSTLEHSITGSIPRFGGIIEVAIKYGASGDTRNKAKRMRTKAFWDNIDNVSTSYRSKTEPLYYIQGGSIGIIPVPPEAGAIAYIDFVQRPYQLTAGTDVIDIPYRFQYPVVNYVQAKAIEATNEDYSQGEITERKFLRELEEVAIAAESEMTENDGINAVEISANSPLVGDPMRF